MKGDNMVPPIPSRQEALNRTRQNIEKKTAKSPGQLYAERENRVRDAISLKEPDRVPVNIGGGGYFAARYAGLNAAAMYYDVAAWRESLKKATLDLEPDLYEVGGGLAGSGLSLEILDAQQILWPGGNLPANTSHQFVEREYLREDEYDLFISDPFDFIVRYYLPRVFGALKPLSDLPPIMPLTGAAVFSTVLHVFARPELKQAGQALFRAAQAQEKWHQAMSNFREEMASLGFPPSSHLSCGGAPFDAVSDYLRGMRGSMLDMYRQPEKLVAACEKILEWRLLREISAYPKATGWRASCALLRGADGFMSRKQYESFYWPGMKRILLSLIERDLVPVVFCEGSCDSRLEYFLELPKGKFVCRFDQTDMVKAKAVLGGHCCISGNVPSSLLQVGSPQEVEEYCHDLIRVAGKGGGFIMTSSGFIDDASPANVKAMVDSVKKYRP
ncbi:MAG: hypothetical protein HY667_00470 [Chloroflexi bacterium]|nr:hypothetical protein [Chloroflexota bacterium]